MASNCGRGENLKLISFENGVSLDISDDLPVVVDALNEPLDLQVTDQRCAKTAFGPPQQEGRPHMRWQEGVAMSVMLLGLGAGAFLVAQRPSFWLEFGVRLMKVLLPQTRQIGLKSNN